MRAPQHKRIGSRLVSNAVIRGAVVAFAGTLARRAGADDGTQRARALFEEAGELERGGQWARAEERVRAALRLRETPQLHYALGWALENEDKLLEARAEYQAVLRLGRERAGAGEALRLATARLGDVEKKTPVIRVRLRGSGRAEAHVIIDGREVAHDEDTATTAANPGSHVVRIERGSTPIAEEIVYVGRGAEQTLRADVTGAVAGHDPAQKRHAGLRRSIALTSPAPGSSERQGSALPWVLLSGGVLLAGGGAALLVSASAEGRMHDTLDARWCASTACSNTVATVPESPEAAEYRRLASDASARQTLKESAGIAMGAVGALGAAIGTVLLLRRPASATEMTAPHASAGPIPGGAMASALVSF